MMLARSFTLLLLLAATSLSACSIPVYHYALKRWASDPYDLVLMGPAGNAQLAAIAEDLAPHGLSRGNLLVWRASEEPLPRDLAAITEVHAAKRDDADARATSWFLRRDGGDRALLSGSVAGTDWSTFADSPARRAIARRILQHDAVVWLLVDASDAEAARIEEDLADIAADITIAVDPGDWSDPAHGGPATWDPDLIAEHPRFSIVRARSDDPREAAFIRQIRAFSPTPVPAGGFLLPVFGRGRMLSVNGLMESDSQRLYEIAEYLTGPCSCTVKALNPGVDLLMHIDWETMLAAEAPLDDLLPPWPSEEVASAPASAATGAAGPTAVATGSGASAPAGGTFVSVWLLAAGGAAVLLLIGGSLWLVLRKDG